MHRGRSGANHNGLGLQAKFAALAITCAVCCPLPAAAQTASPLGRAQSAAAPDDVRWETAAEKQAAGEVRVHVQRAVKIALRDGVELDGTLYTAEGATGPLPTIFAMTPYISDIYFPLGKYYAQHGYALLVVDSRGRGNSGGEFHPFLQDAKDGYDVVEWAAKQPWSTGKIAMIGGSYSGANQWATAKEFPPHLTSIVPTAPGFFGLDFPGVHNVMRSYDMQWLTFTGGVTGNTNAFADQLIWAENFKDLYTGKVRFKDFDRHVGFPSRIYQEWMQHPYLDGYWDSIRPAAQDYARIDMPILTITGAYDGDQPGSIAFYDLHMKYGSARAKDNHYLIIGPWDHGGTRAPQRITYGVDVGAASVLDMNYLSKTWYDWTLNGGPRPSFLKDRVAYYVVGANEWRYAHRLEEIGRKSEVLYLDSLGSVSPSAFQSGLLTATPPARDETVSYVDDPLATQKTLAREAGRAPDYQNETWAAYQDDVLALQGNGVVYHTAPFDKDTDLAGFIKLDLWMSMNVPDTDFRATLYEIRPDGSSILLTQTIERARFMKSLSEPRLVTPGKVEHYTFDRFTFFARRIARGSRLRLVFDGNDNIAWQQNFNSGGVVADETPRDARKATVVIYQDSQRRSSLTLPLAP